MIILWIICVIYYEKFSKKHWKYFHQTKQETFFEHRSINDNINFEILVKIREQSYKLLPYEHILYPTNRK